MDSTWVHYLILHYILLYYWEWTLLPVFLYLFLRFPLLGDRIFSRIEQAGVAIASRKHFALALVPLSLIGFRVALLAFYPVPVPQIHDEFSYLVAADTFAHGRLANPPHPMAAYFDTIHILQQPTYASMYPPAQGFMLALGEILGHPWIGVILSMAAFFAALVWMLQGWFPPRWALLGAVLAFLQFGVFSYWMNSYWGGAVAALGGALVIGAVPRIFRKPSVWDGLLMGLGIAILAISRPLEGVVVCAPVAGAMAVWLFKRPKFSWSVKISRVVVPVGGLLLLTIGFLLYYNWRVTQNPLLMPHVLDDRIHMSVSNYVWGERKPPIHFANHEFEGAYNHWSRNYYTRTWDDFLRLTNQKIIDFRNFFFGIPLLIPLVAFPWLIQDRRTRLVLIQFLCYCVSAICVVWFNPHYTAPAVAGFFALIVQLMRHLRRWEYRGKPIGIGLTRATVVFLALAFCICTVRVEFDPAENPGIGWGGNGNWDRARIISELARTPGKHLVIMRYSQTHHNIGLEWVYNSADIDGSKVVWAREIPGMDMQPLLDYFKDRKVWLVEPDEGRPHLQPYTLPTSLSRESAVDRLNR